jgi:hypothetical protein
MEGHRTVVLSNNLGMLKSGFTINNPTSFRNEVNQDYKNIGQGYSIPNEVTDESVPVNSTAIQSARYDPSDNSLNITYKNGVKEYKFDAKDDLQEWVDAPSKGQITQEWRKTHRYPGY